MKINKNKSLKSLNSFNVDVKTKYFVELNNKEDIQELLKNDIFKNNKIQILGDGNNILFTKDFDGLIIKPNFRGKDIIKEDDNYVWIELGAGEDWDDFVRWSVSKNYEGVENMILIPSSIGGAVSQNIAAYGQNIMDVVESVKAIDLETGDEKIFSNKDCQYTYRDSIFKTELKNKFLITSTIFKLSKNTGKLETSYHERKSRYGSLEEELKTFAKEPYTIQDVMQAVINIRERKLPSVDEYGTCGSIFANPLVSKEKFLELSERISELQSYPINKLDYSEKDWANIKEDSVKIAAGRIIEELGWKGKWIGNVGMFEKHALCTVSNKRATGEEIYNFTEKVREDVKKNFDVDLKYEINII